MKYVFLLFCLLLLFPLYWMISLSFQDVRGVLHLPPNIVPKRVTLINYERIAADSRLLRWAANSIIVTTGALAISLSSTVMAAWAFAVYRFRGRQLIYWAFIASLMIPAYSLMISRFVLVRYMGMINTWWPLMMMGACSPVAIILFIKYFKKIPEALADSARIDGLSELGILFRIILPQCMPLIGYTIITTYIGMFAEFIWPLLLLMDRRKWTLCLGVTKFITEYYSRYGKAGADVLVGISQAGGTLLFLPPLIIFIAFRKTFRKQFLAGGVKE